MKVDPPHVGWRHFQLLDYCKVVGKPVFKVFQAVNLIFGGGIHIKGFRFWRSTKLFSATTQHFFWRFGKWVTSFNIGPNLKFSEETSMLKEVSHFPNLQKKCCVTAQNNFVDLQKRNPLI